MKFLCQLLQKLQPKQTHTQTHRQTHRHDENITSTAYAGGNEVSMSTHSKVIAQTERQTDRQTHTHTHADTTKTLPLPHTREVKICILT